MKFLSLFVLLSLSCVALGVQAQQVETWTCSESLGGTSYLIKFSSDGKTLRLVSSSEDLFLAGYGLDDTNKGWSIIKDTPQGLVAVRATIEANATKSSAKAHASDSYVSLDAMLLDKSTGDLVRVMGAVAEQYDGYGDKNRDTLMPRLKCLK